MHHTAYDRAKKEQEAREQRAAEKKTKRKLPPGPTESPGEAAPITINKPTDR